MSTSGVTSWPLTAQEIITQAYYKLGVYGAGEEPSGTDMLDAMLALNGMLNFWGGERNLYREETTTVDFASGTGEVTLDTDIASINNVWLEETSYNRLLAPWNRSEYLSIPRPGQEGRPTAWYADTTTSGLVLHLWPVPSDDVTVALDYSRRAQTVTDINETIDTPQEWQEALIYGLASRIADMTGSVKNDPSTVMRIDQRAANLYQALLDRDRPDFYRFEPDL